MESEVNWLVVHGSYAVLFGMLILAGLGLPFPEDAVLLAGGVLIHLGVTSLPGTAAVCAAGVIIGDLTIFLMARRLGEGAYRRRFFARLLPPHRRERLERMFARYGHWVVFTARHLAGLRAPVFALAGIHRMRLTAFVAADMAALLISAPIVMGLGYLFADELEVAIQGVARAQHYLVLAAIAAFALGTAWFGAKYFFRRER